MRACYEEEEGETGGDTNMIVLNFIWTVLLNFWGVRNLFEHHEVSRGMWLAARDVSWVFFCGDYFMICYNVCFDIMWSLWICGCVLKMFLCFGYLVR